MRTLLALAAAATLAAGTSAATNGPRQLLCGATLNGVGGDMGKILEKKTGVVKGLDCAQACADREGCTTYQYCGYGSYTDTCQFVTVPEGAPAGAVQASKGECFLGTGHWRQVPTDKPFGGWTVGIACSSIPADPAPVGEEEGGGGGEGGEGAGGEPVPVVAAPVVAAKKPAAAAAAAAPAKAPAAAPAKKAAAAPAPAPAKKAAPAPAGAPAWAAALPPAPVKPMQVPSAQQKAAAVVPPPPAQPELKTASVKA